MQCVGCLVVELVEAAALVACLVMDGAWQRLERLLYPSQPGNRQHGRNRRHGITQSFKLNKRAMLLSLAAGLKPIVVLKPFLSYGETLHAQWNAV